MDVLATRQDRAGSPNTPVLSCPKFKVRR
jgi:hypothetical protein